MVGVALATFAFGNVSAVIPRGYLSDRVGRRALVIVGLSVSGFATALAWLSAPETRACPPAGPTPARVLGRVPAARFPDLRL
jgi:MFS family permease